MAVSRPCPVTLWAPDDAGTHTGLGGMLARAGAEPAPEVVTHVKRCGRQPLTRAGRAERRESGLRQSTGAGASKLWCGPQRRRQLFNCTPIVTCTICTPSAGWKGDWRGVGGEVGRMRFFLGIDDAQIVTGDRLNGWGCCQGSRN